MRRTMALVFLVCCGPVFGQDVIWRKADRNPQDGSAPARFPTGPETPAFRRVRAQTADEFAGPPESWSSTFGKDAKPVSAPREALSKTATTKPKADASKERATVLPAVFLTGNEQPDKEPAKETAAKEPPEKAKKDAARKEAAKKEGLNPWTFQPWDAAFGQIHQQPMGDWLVPAPEMFRPRERLEVRAEYLLWWTRGSNYPPLVTTDSPNAPQVTQGALPPTGTATVLFGGPQDPRLQSGARFGFTYWLGDCGLWGLDANYFFLGSRSDRFAASSDQFPVLGRPFINAITGQENRQLTATPGTNPGDVFALRGAVSVDAPSRLSGWDIGLRRCLCSDCCWKVDVTFGYRELDLFDGVDIHEDIVSLKAVPGAGGLLDPGNRIQVLDSFTTHNHFHGAQAGLRGEYRWNDFIFEGKFNLALGYTDQSVNILGGQTITRLTGQQQTFVGGLLALPSNIGYFSQQRFGVVPEVGVKIGYQLTDNLRVYAGYDFLFWNSVVRASDQIDRRLNPFLVPGLIIPPQPVQGPILPRVPMSTTTYWAQGVSFGLEWRY